MERSEIRVRRLPQSLRADIARRVPDSIRPTVCDQSGLRLLPPDVVSGN